jgi:nicotinate phosphoribosyltransferase
MERFDVIPEAAILDGSAADAYFERTEAALDHASKNPHVVAEVTASQFPNEEFHCFAGIEDAAALLAGHDIDVDALLEGQLFDGGPVLRIEGQYREFARLETSLLGFLSQATGFATQALRARRAAPNVTQLSFGTRHVHPAIAPVVERAALVGGMDGFSHAGAGEVLGYEASGTMPHSLVICFGRDNQRAAWRAFHEAAPEDAPRIALCDTYDDETVEAIAASEELGAALDGVRLDTTSSRRGDFEHIAKEVRWELDERGFSDVDIVLSGGLTAATMHDLRHVADGFGVGSYITDADPVSFGLDIVELDGEPAAKRGKLSGKKAVYRTEGGRHHVVRAHRPGPTDGEALLEPLVRDGEIVRDFDIDDAADRARQDATESNFAWDGAVE